MSANGTVLFPTPVGGAPFELDFAPSILFAVLYGLTCFTGIYRFAQPATRTFCTFGSLVLTTERIVAWSLRAKQAHKPYEDAWSGLTEYWQLTFGLGTFYLIDDIVKLLRSMLVRTTAPEEGDNVPLRSRSKPDTGSDLIKSADWESQSTLPATPDEHQVHRLALYRKICGYTTLGAIIAMITAIVGGSQYPQAMNSAAMSDVVQVLRYVTSAVNVMLLAVVYTLALWAHNHVPGIRRSGTLVITWMSAILGVQNIYRLTVMHNRTTSITSLGPHSLNSTASKIAFYIFHAAPELLVVMALFGINARDMFSTGLLGDYKKKKRKCKKAKKDAAGSVSSV